MQTSRENKQTTQWQKSTNITQKTKDRVTQTRLKAGDELWTSGRVGSSC